MVMPRRIAAKERKRLARAEFAAAPKPPITPARYHIPMVPLRMAVRHFLYDMVKQGKMHRFKQVHIDISEPATGVTEIYIMTV